MRNLLAFVATFAIAAMFDSLNAQEPIDETAAHEIREILNDVWDKWDSANPDHHAHFSEDMTRIWANGDPSSWVIGSSKLIQEDDFVKNAGRMAAKWQNHPQWKKNREIRHVHVNGDAALVTARQSFSMPDSTKRITVNNTGTEVILLRKMNKAWKLTHSLGVKWEQNIWHWDPE